MTKRDELCADLQRTLEKNNSSSKQIQSYITTMMEKHSLPASKIFDYVTLREVVSVLDNTYLFCLCEAIMSDKLELYFTKDEIQKYSKWQYEDQEKFKMPCTFERVIQVAPDQWFTTTTAKELVRMGNSQVLRYNEATQRPLQIVRHGNVETYIPYYNKNAGEAIKESYINGKYIPNYITINIPDGYQPDYNAFGFDLRIDAPYFDLIDGYHRYRTLLDICSHNPDFNYTMGLQICYFPEDRAKYFIYQEDQKTQMTKASAKAMDTYAPQNVIVSRLNCMSGFVLCGKINQNDGIINAADLGVVLGKLYASDNPIEAAKELKEGIEKLVEKNTELFQQKWEKKYLFTVIFMIKNHVSLSKVDKIYKQVLSQNMFNGDTITRADTTKMNKLLGVKEEGGE